MRHPTRLEIPKLRLSPQWAHLHGRHRRVGQCGRTRAIVIKRHYLLEDRAHHLIPITMTLPVQLFGKEKVSPTSFFGFASFGDSR